MNNKNEVLLQVSPPSSTLYNIDTIHDIINLILFGILSYYFYIFYINRKKIENMDMSLFASDDKYATVGLKRKLENMERELIYEKNNFLKMRDMDAIYDPLAPPEQRMEYDQYIYPNVRYNIKTRGEPDDYQLVGLLYNQLVNKNYQLYGRRLYPGAYEWEYYIRSKDIGGLEIKFPIHHYHKNEIYDDTILRIPLDDLEYRVKIYKYDQPRYNPFIL